MTSQIRSAGFLAVLADIGEHHDEQLPVVSREALGSLGFMTRVLADRKSGNKSSGVTDEFRAVALRESTAQLLGDWSGGQLG
jgi:hypothetical protein